MLVTILSLLVLFMILPSALGTLVLFHTLVRRKNEPVDKSNRINHFRLVWFALTREDKFVNLFPWLKNDEWDNISTDLNDHVHLYPHESDTTGKPN